MVAQFLTDATMDEISDELAIARPDSCLIQTRTEGAPGADPSFSGGTTVDCRVTPFNRAMQVTIQGGRVVPEADVTISVPRGTVVDSGAKITVNGQVYVAMDDPDRASFSFELNIPAKDSDG